MAEFRWDELHVERIGNQCHIWGLNEPLDESNCEITYCHLINAEGGLMRAFIQVVGRDDTLNPDALLVIHTGEAHG